MLKFVDYKRIATSLWTKSHAVHLWDIDSLGNLNVPATRLSDPGQSLEVSLESGQLAHASHKKLITYDLDTGKPRREFAVRTFTKILSAIPQEGRSSLRKIQVV